MQMSDPRLKRACLDPFQSSDVKRMPGSIPFHLPLAVASLAPPAPAPAPRPAAPKPGFANPPRPPRPRPRLAADCRGTKLAGTAPLATVDVDAFAAFGAAGRRSDSFNGLPDSSIAPSGSSNSFPTAYIDDQQSTHQRCYRYLQLQSPTQP